MSEYTDYLINEISKLIHRARINGVITFQKEQEIMKYVNNSLSDKEAIKNENS